MVNVVWLRGKGLRYLDIDVVPVDNTSVDSRESFYETLIALMWRLVLVHCSQGKAVVDGPLPSDERSGLSRRLGLCLGESTDSLERLW